MSDLGDNGKYKWTPESTTLLVSVWTDRQVQKQLEYAVKPQLIWESVARYMRKKGYEVTAKQCRSRMKQVLVCYREAKKSGTRAGVERYYESIDKVLENKRSGKIDDENGIDTVDSAQILKSPPKDLKTNVNLKMRGNRFEGRPEPLARRIDTGPGNWLFAHREEHVDSSESNETVLARPHRSLSPVRDVGTNTGTETLHLASKSTRRSLPDDRYRYDIIENNRYSDILHKNAVQNVQNQIIQENMLMRNQLGPEYIGHPQQEHDYRANIGNAIRRNHTMYNTMFQQPVRMSTNCARMQSQLQHCALNQNTAMPQEPKKFGMFGSYVDNPVDHKQFQGVFPSDPSPDIAPNLNEAFCQTSRSPKFKAHNLNETYDQDNEMYRSCVDATTVTNNATFNDDTLSIEFVQDSPSPSENGISGSKNDESFTDMPPNAPLRKKKAQKLEQLMLNAITSQTEVVNKILAAQDSMVSRLLDRDQDRQSRLENRLDQLMTVVHATVLNKSSSSSTKDTVVEVPPIYSSLPTVPSAPLCFSPPPRPGVAPPKLDLVPPKPCRVPCTSPSANIELINQLPIQTRPGVVGPPKPGSIWTKLGPVSQSPFVKAQQQMTAAAAQYVGALNDWRTKSSAERKIARSQDQFLDPDIAKFETDKFLQTERLMEERIENAKQAAAQFLGDKDHSARRKLFNKTPEAKELSAAIVLTQTFLDIERQAEERSRYCPIPRMNIESSDSDDLLTGQGESYDRLRRLSGRQPQKKENYGMVAMDSSTPAKGIDQQDCQREDLPKQTIHQLAKLVMQSARWKSAAAENQQRENIHRQLNQVDRVAPKMRYESDGDRQSRLKAGDWLQDRYSYGPDNRAPEPAASQQRMPIGFIRPDLNILEKHKVFQTLDRQVGFHPELLSTYRRAKDHDILDHERKLYDKQRDRGSYPPSNRELMDKYFEDNNVGRRDGKLNRRNDVDNDDDEDVFLDTTTSMKPYRKPSLTSTGTSGTGSRSSNNCVIS